MEHITSSDLTRAIQALRFRAARYEDTVLAGAATPSWEAYNREQALKDHAAANALADIANARRADERDAIRADCYGRG